MALHHIVPVFLLSRWASADAWRCEEGRLPPAALEGTRARDLNCLAHRRPRHWPLCVLGKDGVIRSGVVKHTCAERDFYRLHHVATDDDQVAGRILVSRLAGEPETEVIPSEDVQVDAQAVERVRFRRIDSAFANLLPLLLDHRHLTRRQRRDLLRFVAWAAVRTPAWRDRYGVEFTERAVAESHRQREANPVKRLLASTPEAVAAIRGAHDAIRANPHAALPHELERTFSRGIGISVLRAPRPGPRFVHCDEPARPFPLGRVRSFATEPRAKIDQRTVRIAVPIGPEECLLLAGDTRVSRRSRQVQFRRAPATLVQTVNTALAINATKEIVLPSPSTSGLFEPWLDLADIPVHAH
jgi:hypothetical protein